MGRTTFAPAFKASFSVTQACQEFAGGGGGGGHQLASLFTGSTEGFLFDATVSVLATDTSGLVPCVSVGDPVAYAEDVSGLGNHLTQATANNQPLYYLNGSIPGFRCGYTSAQRRWIERAMTLGNDFSLYMVRRAQSTGGQHTHGRIDMGGFLVLYSQNGATLYCYDSGSQTGGAVTALDSSPQILRFIRGVDGSWNPSANNLIGRAINMDDSINGNPGSATSTISGSVTWKFGGDNGGNRDVQDEHFLMFLDRAVTSTEDATIRSYIETTFAGLT